jgi:hypothetical protein
LSDKTEHLYFVHSLPNEGISKPTAIIYSCDPANNHALTKIDENIYEGNKLKCYFFTYQQCAEGDKLVYSKYDKVGDKHILGTFLFSLDTKTKTKIYEIPTTKSFTLLNIYDVSLVGSKVLFVESTKVGESYNYARKIKVINFQ